MMTRLCMLDIHSCSFTELTVDCNNEFKIFNVFNKSCLLLCFYITMLVLLFTNNVFTLLVLSLFKKIFNL